MKLEKITPENYQFALSLSVKERQKEYIASNMQSLAEAYAYRAYAEAYLISLNGTYIGFCLLQVDLKEQFFDIWRLMIDKDYQGKGYGKQALLIIIDYLKTKGSRTIHISHQENNYGVSRLYQSLGFVYTGEIEDGEVLMTLKCH